MDSFSERRRAILFLILAAALWSTGGVFIKFIDWQPPAILAGRSLFASLVFLAYLRRLPVKWNRWQLLAAGSSLATQFLFVSATKLTTAANAIFLQYTAPIYVALLGLWLLHERPARTDWVAMLVIFAGMALFFGDRLNAEGLYGNVLAVLSGVTSALLMVSLRAQKDGAPAESMLIAGLLAGIFGAPFILKEAWTPFNWGVIAFLGVFQIGLAFVCFTQGIKHITALESNLIGALEPVLNPVWVFLFYGESMGRFALIGGVIVLAGVALGAVGGARGAGEGE